MLIAPVSPAPPSIAPRAHVVIATVRNESLRLPYFMTYYRGLGFDQFIFVDNGSTDGTRSFLLSQGDVCLFESQDSFAQSGFGVNWINDLLNKYCADRWILFVDADELLMWPGSEGEKIQQLTARLDAARQEALFTLLLDMYSDKPFGTIGYVSGAPFVDYCPYFDRGPYGSTQTYDFPWRLFYGGVRARVFRSVAPEFAHPPTVSKVPLVRWTAGQAFVLVAHKLEKDVPLAPLRGALLHFKMFDDLVAKCDLEVARGEHFGGAREYWALSQVFQQAPDRSFFNPNVSVRFTGTDQLVSLGLMKVDAPF